MLGDLLSFNTRLVMLCTAMLGVAAGVIGSFMLLRRRALLGDALSHATLPGIAIAFLLAAAAGWQERSLAVLLTGAIISGLLGVAVIFWIRHFTRLKEDAALGIVLSVFFGFGVCVLGVVQQTSTGHAAGLESFIYGKAASMITRDAWLIGIVGGMATAVSLLLFKELELLCFDAEFARAQGYSVTGLDALLMALVVAVTIVGLQAVGLILIIALFIIPPAAARFWSDQMRSMTAIAAACGGLSSLAGSLTSATFPKSPSGALIVLFAGGVFLVSFLFGTQRGVIVRTWRQWRLSDRIEREHFLRAVFERLEVAGQTQGPSMAAGGTVSLDELVPLRSWTRAQLGRLLQRCIGDGLVQDRGPSEVCLTTQGLIESQRLVHEHRLLELYLITHADTAPACVDRNADAIEHYLEPALIRDLEQELERRKGAKLPASPHPL